MFVCELQRDERDAARGAGSPVVAETYNNDRISTDKL